MIEITPEYLASQGLSTTFPHRFWAKVNKNGPVPAHCPELGPCWIWKAHKAGSGYGMIRPGPAGKSSIGAHVAGWILHCGPITDGLWVLHHCDNRRCVRPTHLWLGTPTDNVRDMIAKGRQFISPRDGENNGRHRLTRNQVEMIRFLCSQTDITQTALAEFLGTTQGHISNIVKKRIWATC